jgi:hypothetical protein
VIRGLTYVAIGGAVLALVAISLSGGFHSVKWHVPHGIVSFDDEGDGPDLRLTGNEPIITRDLAWSGGEALSFEVPAHIVFTQGPTPRITLTGPDALVNHVVLDGDALKLDRSVHNTNGLHGFTIAVTAPALDDFDLESAQDLTINSIHTDTLTIEVAGAGDVHASGSARNAKVTVEGLGNVNLDGMTLTDSTIEIDGLGHVTAGPTGDVSVEINGAGAVNLTKRPAHLDKEINGAGTVDQPTAPAGQSL